MNENDRLRVIAELDTLAQQVAATILRFEATGFTAVMKDDYLELHALQHRVAQMRLQYCRAENVTGLDTATAAVRH